MSIYSLNEVFSRFEDKHKSSALASMFEKLAEFVRNNPNSASDLFNAVAYDLIDLEGDDFFGTEGLAID